MGLLPARAEELVDDGAGLGELAIGEEALFADLEAADGAGAAGGAGDDVGRAGRLSEREGLQGGRGDRGRNGDWPDRGSLTTTPQPRDHRAAMDNEGRWKFLGEANPDERMRRERTLRLIDDWWIEFSRRTADILAHFTRKKQWDLPAWMETHLQAIDSRLMWEFGPAVSCKGHRLVVTPESVTHLRPLVTTVLERAPVLPGWEFYDGRVAEDVSMAVHTVRGRTGGDIADMVVKLERGEGNLLDLTFMSPRIASSDDSKARADAFVAAEALLGERTLERWIGRISVAALDTAPSLRRWLGRVRVPEDTVKLDQLKPSVESLVRDILQELPDEPHCRRSNEPNWTLLELKPPSAPDYPDQYDLIVAKTTSLPLWKATHAPAFFDERFSRHGETFAFVKIDGSQGLENGFADKSEIEDALVELLEPNHLGTQVGGGTGLRYSYVDLALTRVDEAVTAIRERLRAGHVPLRSWIQFFGADLGREWIGVYPDSPPPPMPDSE